jgi:superfamily II DNA or RNA helicase
MSVNLHDYQQEASDKFFNAGKRGTLLYATGTGKTEIAIGIIERYLKENKGANVLFIAPRITLVEQTHERMKGYGLDSGMYYSEEKDLEKNVTISTYQSIAKLTYIVENYDLIVFDEVHLASDYAEKYSEIMKLGHKHGKDMLCLTATLDENDQERYGTVLETCPVLDKINLNTAIKKKYLSALTIEDHSVELVPENKRAYNELSSEIRSISNELGTSNPRDMSMMLKRGQWQAGKWFKAVQARKLLTEYNEEKMDKVKELVDGFNGEQTIVFCERVPTLELLKEKLGDKFEFITAKTGKKKRKEILENFGKTFSVIGTVHTLDLGYDVPDIKHGIIVASNKNETTIVQRIGRVVRKAEGKTMSKIYVIYAKGTHECELYNKIREAVREQ